MLYTLYTLEGATASRHTPNVSSREPYEGGTRGATYLNQRQVRSKGINATLSLLSLLSLRLLPVSLLPFSLQQLLMLSRHSHPLYPLAVLRVFYCNLVTPQPEAVQVTSLRICWTVAFNVVSKIPGKRVARSSSATRASFTASVSSTACRTSTSAWASASICSSNSSQNCGNVGSSAPGSGCHRYSKVNTRCSRDLILRMVLHRTD